MDWKSVVREWRKLSPDVQKACRLERVPVQVWQSMKFEGDQVDLASLRLLYEAMRHPDPTKSSPRGIGDGTSA